MAASGAYLCEAPPGRQLIRSAKKARMDLPDYAIEATGLVKMYGDKAALAGVITN